MPIRTSEFENRIKDFESNLEISQLIQQGFEDRGATISAKDFDQIINNDIANMDIPFFQKRGNEIFYGQTREKIAEITDKTNSK